MTIVQIPSHNLVKPDRDSLQADRYTMQALHKFLKVDRNTIQADRILLQPLHKLM